MNTSLRQQWRSWFSGLIILTALAFFCGAHAQVGPKKPGPIVHAEIEVVDADSGLSLIASKDVPNGMNAFAFMTNTVAATYDMNSSYGAFVNTICGVDPKKHGKYWALYINGTYATAGISSITITNDILIRWKSETRD